MLYSPGEGSFLHPQPRAPVDLRCPVGNLSRWWSGRTARPRALPRGIPAGERQRQRAGQAVHSPAREVEASGNVALAHTYGTLEAREPRRDLCLCSFISIILTWLRGVCDCALGFLRNNVRILPQSLGQRQHKALIFILLYKVQHRAEGLLGGSEQNTVLTAALAKIFDGRPFVTEGYHASLFVVCDISRPSCVCPAMPRLSVSIEQWKAVPGAGIVARPQKNSKGRR